MDGPPPPAGRLAAGQRVGPYEIAAPLAVGGMGEVYQARDVRLGREVAVKILPAALSGDEERLLRFEQEARAAGALNHPSVLVVHDVGSHDGAPYLVTELLEGQTLRERLSSGPLPARRAVEIAAEVAAGLAQHGAARSIGRVIPRRRAARDAPLVLRDAGLTDLFVLDYGS